VPLRQPQARYTMSRNNEFTSKVKVHDEPITLGPPYFLDHGCSIITPDQMIVEFVFAWLGCHDQSDLANQGSISSCLSLN
jgi:hypothetical protein